MSSFALFQKFILLSVTSRLINDHFPLIGSHLTYKDHLRQVGVKLRQSRESELKGELITTPYVQFYGLEGTHKLLSCKSGHLITLKMRFHRIFGFDDSASAESSDTGEKVPTNLNQGL